MTNRIVKALEDGAKRLGKTLGEDAGKSVKNLYHDTGDRLRQVTKNHAETDAKHASAMEGILKGRHGDMPKDPHVSPSSSPHTSGGPGGGGPKDPLKGPKGPVKGPGSGRPNSSGPAPLRDGANRDGVGSSKPAGGRCKGGDPIDLVSGEMILTETDVRLPGLLDLVVERTHLSSYRYGQWFGGSWASTLDQRLEADERGLVLATQFPAGQLDGAVADHLVGVHVGLRPGARLPHVEREVIVQSARDDFVGHPLDQVGLPGR